ncbi:cobalt/nickel transport system ATP-binding protein [Mesocricetibacter intestinalis]|uniref:Cobalt/nickel transport system ATP-binding protein n=1 Tax=Mesocricetibacter intestinalis TaxID=1521930 RepID=A0A4V6PWZ1_9PAST|nr:energy-coupling factor ABC transporter ATP-binding protein [Mesocricetibacter intestinalis]TDQ57907.1 cobalt/nickel transport system ATP-binding protein [Mesocricetibacter intestinalis]
MNILKVKELSIALNGRPIIENLSFRLESDQRLFLQGEIGCGKSTLLHCLLGFVPFQHGEILLFGTPCKSEVDFSPFRGKIGLCFQNPEDQLFGPTVLDDVAFGPLNLGLSQTEAYAAALKAVEALDIAHLKNRPVNLLSGGEKNFTALAGVLAMNPSALFLDEPTNGLDSKNIEKMTALLIELHLPMLIASHDQLFTARMAHQILSLEKHR